MRLVRKSYFTQLDSYKKKKKKKKKKKACILKLIQNTHFWTKREKIKKYL